MYSVIVVDDNRKIREGLSSFIDNEVQGFSVAECFCDGADAIEYIRHGEVKPDVVLTDIKMSNISGLELAGFVKKERLNITVVLLSAYQEFEFARAAIASNVYDYLLKPIKFEKLKELFDEIRDNLDAKTEEELLSKLGEYDFRHLIQRMTAGIYDNADELIKALRDKAISARLATLPYKLVVIGVDNTKFYSRERIVNAIDNILHYKSLIGYHILDNGKELTLLITTNSMSMIRQEDLFMRETEDFAQNEIQLLANMLGISFEIQSSVSFENLYKVTEYFSNCTDDSCIQQLKQVILMDVMQHDVPLAKKSIRILFNKLSSVDRNYASSFLKDFLQSIEEYFGEKEAAEIAGGLDELHHKFEKELLDVAFDGNTDHQSFMVQKALSFINENYMKDICLSDVANHIYLNPVYFGRIFKEKTGVTFTDYLIDKKLSRAKELLKMGKSVSDTSMAVGYSNVQYFIRIFKKNTGMPPGRYKRVGGEEDETNL